jgi:hypothetical protein
LESWRADDQTLGLACIIALQMNKKFKRISRIKMGNNPKLCIPYKNSNQMVFSSSAPLWRQLPATWLAGFLITTLPGSGALLRFPIAGDGVGVLAWISAAIFIPSFALALGIWSSSNKLFEVFYISMGYLGPMNKVLAVDHIGANSNGNIGFLFLCLLR